MGLKEQQEALVRALVAGGPNPAGCRNVQAAREQLLRKRAGEVGQAWPKLRASLGATWYTTFAEWARTRPPQGSYRDGLEFAATLALTGAALAEYEQRTRPPSGSARATIAAQLASWFAATPSSQASRWLGRRSR